MGIWFWYSPLRNSQLIWLTHDGPEVCAKNWTELVFTVATLPCHAYFCALSCLQSARVRGHTTFCCIVSLGCVLLFSSNNDGSLSHCCVCKLYAGWIALFKCLCGCTETTLTTSVQLLKYCVKTFALQMFRGICVFHKTTKLVWCGWFPIASWLYIRKIHCSKLTILRRTILACLWPFNTRQLQLLPPAPTWLLPATRSVSTREFHLYSTLGIVLQYLWFHHLFLVNLWFKCLLESFSCVPCY